jgi:DNA polymerase V
MCNNPNNLKEGDKNCKKLSYGGFASVAEDYIEHPLDLNNYLIKNPLSTYFLMVNGDSLNHIGIFNNDILIVDKSLSPRDNNIVIAELENELVIRKLKIKNNDKFLISNNKKDTPQKITNNDEFTIWGVVISTIHRF